jgi:hypothetical protein
MNSLIKLIEIVIKKVIDLSKLNDILKKERLNNPNKTISY